MTELSRRELLELIAGAGVAAVSCTAPGPRPELGEAMGEVEGASAIVTVERLRPAPWQTRDPFLFCVHHDDAYPAGNERLGPNASLAGRNLGQDFEGIDGWRMYHGDAVPGFPQHPHRGFETVTVVRRGLVDHSDSLGAAARYGRGDVQWLTAGGGILHAEMFPLLDESGPNPTELFQIWLNLPRANKMVPAHFSMLWADTIPKRVTRDASGRETELTVVAGAYGELAPPSPPPSSWASQPGSDVSIWTLKMQDGARFTLPPAPAGTNRTLYYFAGGNFPGRGLRAGGREIPPGHLIDLRPDASVTLESGSPGTELLLLGGRPIGEPVVQYGPFVMSTQGEIRQAFADYQRTRFGGWPWPSDEPVHAREDRFARHADGRIERPA